MLERSDIPNSWIQHDEKVKPYKNAHKVIGWSGKAVGVLIAIFFLSKGRWAFDVTQFGFLAYLKGFVIPVLVMSIVGVFFGFLSQRIEKRFELSKQTWGSWFKDQGKGLVLGIVLGTIVLGILYFCIGTFPRYWWLFASILLILFSVVLAQLAPVLLLPLFYEMKPLENQSLKERLLSLSKQKGVDVKDVYHLGLGDKTEKGNAAFMGLGKTKRIVIGDTLYNKFPQEEIEAVFSHELGHQVHWDLWRGIVLSAVSLVFIFWLTNWACKNYCFRFLDTNINTPFGLFVFFVTLSILQKPIGWSQLLFSRYLENQADDFAADEMKQAKPLASALERLCFQNFSQFVPSKWTEFFEYSHPAPWRRIMRLRS